MWEVYGKGLGKGVWARHSLKCGTGEENLGIERIL